MMRLTVAIDNRVVTACSASIPEVRVVHGKLVRVVADCGLPLSASSFFEMTPEDALAFGELVSGMARGLMSYAEPK